MIEVRQQLLYEVMGEADALLRLHYNELTLNKDRVILNPAWEEYAALEHLKRFVLFTARQDGKLIGYSAFFVNRHLHYADLTVAFNDVLFLHPEYRATSTAGLRLLRFADAELKEIGANKIVYHAKLDTNLIPILHRLGYKTEEMVLGKLL